MWDVEEDSSLTDPHAYADHIVDSVRPGSIVLIHPMYRGNQTARDAMPLVVVSKLKSKAIAWLASASCWDRRETSKTGQGRPRNGGSFLRSNPISASSM